VAYFKSVFIRRRLKEQGADQDRRNDPHQTEDREDNGTVDSAEYVIFGGENVGRAAVDHPQSESILWLTPEDTDALGDELLAGAARASRTTQPETFIQAVFSY